MEFDLRDEQERLGSLYAQAERVASDATWLTALLAIDVNDEKILEVSEKVDALRRTNRETRSNDPI
jgi:hypothetical protein